jgi:hypothetical protein
MCKICRTSQLAKRVREISGTRITHSQIMSSDAMTFIVFGKIVGRVSLETRHWYWYPTQRVEFPSFRQVFKEALT